MSRVNFSVNYAPRIATSQTHGTPWSEFEPEVHVYLSQQLSPGHYEVIRVSSQRVPEPVQLDIKSAQIPLEATIGFAGYCKTFNDDGKLCKTTAGFARLELGQVIHALERVQPGQRVFFKLELREHVDRDVSKGSLEVSFVAGDSLHLASGTRLLESVPRTHFSEAHRHHCESRMNAAIKRSLDCFYGPYKPLIPQLARIHCPEFKTGASIAPGSAYVWQEPPSKTPESFFLNAKRIVFDRVGASESVFNAVIEDALRGARTSASELTSAVALVCDMLSLFSSSKYYLADKVNENTDPQRYDRFLVKNVEHYKCARCGEDDCEGDGECIYMLLHKEFCASEFQDRTLRNAQRILERYIPFVPLAAVTLASASDLSSDNSSIDHQNVMAHIFAMIVPRVQVYAMLRRSNPGKEHYADAIDFTNTPRQAWEDTLETCVLEGTGWLCAVQKPPQLFASDTSAMLKVCARQDALEQRFPEIRASFSSRIFGNPKASPQNLSPFYKYLVAAYTSYFLERGVPFSDVAFVNEATRTYGVPFGEFLYSSGVKRIERPEFGLHVCTEWTPEEIETARSVIALEEPYPPLFAPSAQETQSISRRIDALMNSIYKRHMRYPSQSARNPGASTRTAAPISIARNDCVTCQIRAEEFDDSVAELVEQIMREQDAEHSFRYLDHVIYPIARVPTRDVDEPPLTIVDVRFYF